MAVAASSATLSESGAQAAELLLDEGVEVAQRLHDPFARAYADALTDGLAAGLANPRGWMRNVLDGTGRLARNLNVEPEHGLVELIQNADDVGARCVRFAISRRRGRELLVVHDGDRVRAPHVLGMTLALVSTKPEDASATGKFGIGLKTITRLASSFEVHCSPYHFRVVDQRLERVSARKTLPRLYKASQPETLLALALRDEYPDDGLAKWFEEFGSDSLLFMRSVRRLELRAGDGTLVATRELKRGRSRRIRLVVDGDRVDADELELRDDRGDTWWRVSLTRRPPVDASRTDKATPAEAPFAVAYSSRPATGRLFAGLPLAVGGSLPFNLHALFDTDASRSDLLQDRWNAWVLNELTHLCAAAAVRRLRADPAAGWSAVPLADEVRGVVNSWLASRLASMVDAVQEEVRVKAKLPHDGDALPLQSHWAEVDPLEPILDDEQLARLTGGPIVRREMRDTAERWRAVLTELDITSWLQIGDALSIFDWDDTKLSATGDWCLALLTLGLETGHRSLLVGRRCLLLADGGRIAPASARDQSLLLGEKPAAAESLAEHLGLVRPLDAAFLAQTDAAAAVRQWLHREVRVRTRPSDEDALNALAYGDIDEPRYLDDRALKLLQAALRAVPAASTADLARRIGERVLVDGQEFSRGFWRQRRVRPSEAYLPSTIDTGSDTWAKAAGQTEGLAWIHPRYARDLRPKRVAPTRGPVDPEVTRQRRAAAAAARKGVLSLFSDLGAEYAPRLEKRVANDWRYGEGATKVRRSQLTIDQRDALGDTRFSGLQNDRLSPDLEVVLRDIAKSKVVEARPRAAALIAALSRAWPRLYAQHETARAVWAYQTMQHVGDVPATWIGRAAAIRWMTNERGHRKPPRDLAVRTMAFEAIFGDAPQLYAHGLTATHLDAAAVRGFRFIREPRASTLLDRIAELRSAELRGRRVDLAAVRRCYRALSEASPTAETRRRRLDDLTVPEVRSRFRSKVDGATGLVRASDGWKAPAEVLLGRPIFKSRRSFVATDAPALWRLLGMREPSAVDCIDVLREIAETGAPGIEDTAVLIETYRYLTRLAAEGALSSNALRRVPLWVGGWRDTRPVYAVTDRTLQEDLGERVAVWRPPVRLSEVAQLIKPLGVTLLDQATFRLLGINTGALAAGSAAQSRFQLAAAHLSEWLALNDAELHDALASLPPLTEARIAVNAALHVDVPIPKSPPETVRRHAHVQRTETGLLFAFARAPYANDGEVVGGLLGELLDVEDRAHVVLAHGWLRALERVDREETVTGLKLAAPATEAAGDRGVNDGVVTPPPKSTSKVQQHSQAPQPPHEKPSDRTPPPPVAPRKLKTLSEIEVEAVWATSELGPDATTAPPGARGPSGAPPAPPQPGTPTTPSETTPTPGLGPASWTPDERETRGLQVLSRELKKRYGLILSDTRKQPNVGADAVDQHGRFYELKAHAGPLTDSEGLQPSEFVRAQEEKENFVLAVVAGLEEGERTVVKLVGDPLRRLKWEPGVDIQVHGLLKAEWAPEEAS